MTDAPPPRCRDCGAELSTTGSGPRCPSCGTSVVIPSVSLGGILRSDTLTIGESLGDFDGDTPVAIGPRANLTDAGLRGEVTLVPEPSSETDQDTVPEVLAAAEGDRRYVLAGEIGRGGMGAVVRAVDRDLRRDVALKLLLRDDDLARDRFVEEAQVAGQLEHPNIVPVHDLGADADGRLFFTMKLVKGRSLAAVLDDLRDPAPEGEQPSVRRLLRNFLGVLDAIAFAHDRGVIHRDLKPANIMLGDFGEVLVMDWGLARVIRGEQGTRRFVARRKPVAPGRGADARLATLVHGFHSQAAGPIEGTPAYMSPEQARGDLAAIDERSDIYSLGAILYEILCLSPPVRGASLKTILEDVIAHRILAPQDRAPHRGIPLELSAIAMKALAADPAERYQKVLEFRRDIELFLEGRQVSAKEDTPWEALVKMVRRNQEVSIAIGVSVAVVLVLTIVLFTAIVKERHRYQLAYAESQKRLAELKREQEHRALDQRRAAPALVARARRSIDRKEFAEARQDVLLARDYDPALREAHLLAAHLAIQERSWGEAAALFDSYRRLTPEDTGAAELARLCTDLAASTGTPDAVVLSRVSDLLVEEGAFAIAEGLYQDSKSVALAHRIRLEQTWPGCTRTGYSMDADGRLTLLGLAGRSDVTDLAPLTGLPIARLSLARTRVLDLKPLRGMPLRELTLAGTPVRRLDALADLPLLTLDLSDTPVSDLSPLTGLPLTSLALDRTEVVDLQPLQGLPLTELRLEGTRITDLRPLQDPKGPAPTLERLILPPGVPLGLQDLRLLPRLGKVGTAWPLSWEKVPSAADFWSRPIPKPVNP